MYNNYKDIFNNYPYSVQSFNYEVNALNPVTNHVQQCIMKMKNIFYIIKKLYLPT